MNLKQLKSFAHIEYSKNILVKDEYNEIADRIPFKSSKYGIEDMFKQNYSKLNCNLNLYFIFIVLTYEEETTSNFMRVKYNALRCY